MPNNQRTRVAGLPSSRPSPRLLPRVVPVRGRAVWVRQWLSLDALRRAVKTDRSVLFPLYHNRSLVSSLEFTDFPISVVVIRSLGAFSLYLNGSGIWRCFVVPGANWRPVPLLVSATS